MKRLIYAAVAFSLMLVFIQPSAAQTAEKSLKSLKKSLTKNSRYGDEVIYFFNPVNFNNCEVSYRFKRLSENGSERFSAVEFDRMSTLARNNTVANRDLPEAPSMAQQNTRPSQKSSDGRVFNQANALAKVFYNNSFPYYSYGVDNRTFFLEQVVTIIDLSEIDPNSIKLQSAPNGREYIVFRALKDKSAISKRALNDAGSVIEIESDFVPVASENGGNKISAALVEAVNACQQ
jgi:hypothetical protein